MSLLSFGIWGNGVSLDMVNTECASKTHQLGGACHQNRMALMVLARNWRDSLRPGTQKEWLQEYHCRRLEMPEESSDF